MKAARACTGTCSGMIRIYRILLPVLLLLAADAAQVSGSVKLGIDTLVALNYPDMQGRRIGLVTNPSGVNAAGVSTIDVLQKAPGIRLTALFAPEHGVYGDIKAGDHVESRRDSRTGLMVHSLYGATRKPTPAMLREVDVIVYDLQDIGVRSYTFISTLGLVMQAAAENGKEVYVLDRPNPLGGFRIEGNGVDASLRSFVGQYDIPYVYGLTIGELSLWINEHYLERPCRLRVFKMGGWTRSMTWPETGLKWVPTSPNIPAWESAFGYVATGLLGDIGITNGANVHDRPFMVVAGERIRASMLAEWLLRQNLKGIEVKPVDFFPKNGAYTHIAFHGVSLKIQPHAEAHLLKLNYQVLDALKVLQPQKNYFQTAKADSLLMFDKINGGSANRQKWLKGWGASELRDSWRAKENSWRQERKPYLLYPET